nr:MAG TPA: hypothetical protein [Bacteriophage sp.]
MLTSNCLINPPISLLVKSIPSLKVGISLQYS